jgi:hypothetical protein
MCVVYGLRAQDSELYFYIGSTKFTAEKRLSTHLDYIRLGYNSNRHLCNKVNKVGPENVVVDVLEDTNPLDRWAREEVWIDKLIANGHPLTNLMHSRDFERQETIIDEYDYRSLMITGLLWYDRYQHGERGVALNPSNQEFLEQLERIMVLSIETMIQKYPDELQRIVLGDAQMRGDGKEAKQAADI